MEAWLTVLKASAASRLVERQHIMVGTHLGR